MEDLPALTRIDDDRRVTRRMMDAGIAALRASADWPIGVKVTSIYIAMREERKQERAEKKAAKRARRKQGSPRDETSG